MVDPESLLMARSAPWTARCLPLAAAIALAPRAVIADASLVVTRDAGAARCPNDAEVRRLAEAARVPSAVAPAHAYRITFRRAHGLLRADIVDETASRARAVEDRGPACGPLGQAVAVVLATMWSSEQEEAHSAEETADPPASPPAVTPPPSDTQTTAQTTAQTPPASEPVAARPTRFAIGAGTGLALGIVRPAAPAIVIDAAAEHDPIAFAIGALWIPQQELSLAPGSIDVQLIAASARACAFAWRPVRVGACALAFAGALVASARGFDITRDRMRPWIAVGLEAFIEGPSPIAFLRYRVGASFLVPTHAERFTIANEGVAYDTPAIGGLLTLAIEIAP